MSAAPREFDDEGNKWWAVDASAGREERVKRGRDASIAGGLRGAAIVGTVGVVTHGVATWRSEFYRKRFYLPGKVFVVSSFFVAGWWIYGEHEFRHYINQQAEVDAAAMQSRRDAMGIRFIGQDAPKKIAAVKPVAVPAPEAGEVAADGEAAEDEESPEGAAERR
ncbi:hypothetical protein FNF31_03611 [Cafeteria roenbergensis]|uniref:Uncharacterized protein n=1 Tax=Cafeteria roenbergensis TaxID=33653 RepID=A0A5A8D8T4_CAFRO|nr:hypothetical protein FNF31_03611 [Cafeteria roenbergensis]KAA0166377.1 hypothetical protein FNF28_03146 [Cafeteria roenbergensis]